MQELYHPAAGRAASPSPSQTDFVHFPHIRDSAGCGSISRNPFLLLLTPFGLNPKTGGFGRSSSHSPRPAPLYP